jgi:hypothetical protein
VRPPDNNPVRFLQGEDGPTAVKLARVTIGAVTPLGTKSSGSCTTAGNRFPVGS